MCMVFTSFSKIGLCLRIEEKKRRVNIEDVFKQINGINRENYAITVEYK